jgi:hypothetical protein
MNIADFTLGQNMASRRADAAIDEWEDHANRLKQKLRDAEAGSKELAKQSLFESARVDGLRAVVSAMEDEIRRLDPNSSLLNKSTRDNIAAHGINRYLAPHGYLYDLKTFTVSKIR